MTMRRAGVPDGPWPPCSLAIAQILSVAAERHEATKHGAKCVRQRAARCCILYKIVLRKVIRSAEKQIPRLNLASFVAPLWSIERSNVVIRMATTFPHWTRAALAQRHGASMIQSPHRPGYCG